MLANGPVLPDGVLSGRRAAHRDGHVRRRDRSRRDGSRRDGNLRGACRLRGSSGLLGSRLLGSRRDWRNHGEAAGRRGAVRLARSRQHGGDRDFSEDRLIGHVDAPAAVCGDQPGPGEVTGEPHRAAGLPGALNRCDGGQPRALHLAVRLGVCRSCDDRGREAGYVHGQGDCPGAAEAVHGFSGKPKDRPTPVRGTASFLTRPPALPRLPRGPASPVTVMRTLEFGATTEAGPASTWPVIGSPAVRVPWRPRRASACSGTTATGHRQGSGRWRPRASWRWRVSDAAVALRRRCACPPRSSR